MVWLHGRITAWLSGHRMDERLKCMLLLEPWFGCMAEEELQNIKWTKPALILSSEQWMKNEKYLKDLTEIVIKNGMNDGNEWECVKNSVHVSFSDIPFWAPGRVTGARKGYSAQEWNDLICKRSVAFIAEHVPKLKEMIGNENLDCDQSKLVKFF